MNKKQLCAAVAKRNPGLSPIDVTEVIESMIKVVIDEAAEGHNVRINGFGMWRRVRRRARSVYCPVNGLRTQTVARDVLSFKSYVTLP
jgi:nucleoid DNA-binding protein